MKSAPKFSLSNFWSIPTSKKNGKIEKIWSRFWKENEPIWKRLKMNIEQFLNGYEVENMWVEKRVENKITRSFWKNWKKWIYHFLKTKKGVNEEYHQAKSFFVATRGRARDWSFVKVENGDERTEHLIPRSWMAEKII